MRQYLVRVHCCGPRWLVHVPALDEWTLVPAKNVVKSVAAQMISKVTDVEPGDLGLDLEEGRVLGNVDEFIYTHPAAQRVSCG